MAELRLAIDGRLKSDCSEKDITFEGLVEDKLNQGRLKLVQIYYERLMKEQSQHTAFSEEWSQSDLNFINNVNNHSKQL